MFQGLKVWWYARQPRASRYSYWYAAHKLWDLKDARGVKPLVEALEKGDYNVRKTAAGALGSIGDTRAVEPLIKALADRSSEMRELAAESLGQLGDRRAIEPLYKALLDGNPDAVYVLGQLGDRRVFERLIERLSHGEFRAPYAVGKLGDPAWVELDAIPRDCNGLQQRAWQLLAAALQTLEIQQQMETRSCSRG